MRKKLLEKLRESVVSVGPIVVIVLILNFTIAPLSPETMILFITGALLLMLGVAIFTMGSDMAMTPMGELIGAKLTSTRKLWLIVLGCFVLGFAVTIAEPDLQVLADQVQSIPTSVLLVGVACGVGLFLVLAVLRIIFQIKLKYTFLALYGLLFVVSLFTNPEYIPVGFDSGGVTTGPITVPFILALGVGISAVRSGKSAEEDSFGLTGICSVGPILAVLIMGMFFKSSEPPAEEAGAALTSVGDLVREYVFGSHGLIAVFKEVVFALLPILVIFILFQIVRLRLAKTQLIRILVGVVYTLVGLTLFLTGASVGFMPAGRTLGGLLAELPYNWILIPLGVLIGCFVILAEPALHVLNKQVEEITGGSISKRMMMIGMAAGVGAAIGLSMVRTLFGIPVWVFFLIGYALALGLTFVVPSMFTAIAFDSGGVASGTMAATFVLPFALGVCDVINPGNVLIDAFGIVGMIAMMPPVTIQLMGLLYKIKMRRAARLEAAEDSTDVELEPSLEDELSPPLPADGPVPGEDPFAALLALDEDAVAGLSLDGESNHSEGGADNE